MPSKLRTLVAVDDPMTLDASWKGVDRTDRRFIDDQIQAVQGHLIRSALRGVTGTWMLLDSGSLRDGAAGDCVCLSPSSALADSITHATGSALTASGGLFGVLTASYKRGSLAHVAMLGALPPSVTGLAALAGSSQFVRVSTTARCERVSSLSGGDFPVGLVDAVGNLSLRGSSIGGSGGGGGGGTSFPPSGDLAMASHGFTGARDPASAQEFATKNYVDNVGATVVDATPSAGTTTTMSTVALADNTVYEIVATVTVRDVGNNIFSAYHSQKWARTGGGGATLIQANDPVQVAITGISATASTLVGSGNSVLLRFSPAVANRYHADVYVRSVALTHA